ncbi:hypothetical protein SARC_16028, partial [Sphaeroforma arctica JP610]
MTSNFKDSAQVIYAHLQKKYRSIIQDMKQQLLMKDDIIYDKDNLISRLRDTIAMLR